MQNTTQKIGQWLIVLMELGHMYPNALQVLLKLKNNLTKISSLPKMARKNAQFPISFY